MILARTLQCRGASGHTLWPFWQQAMPDGIVYGTAWHGTRHGQVRGHCPTGGQATAPLLVYFAFRYAWFNTTKSGKIESGSLPQPSDMAPKARPNCETSRLSSQNVPFQDAKRAISQAKTAQMPSLCLTKFNTLVIYLIEI